ncbi:MAG: hypothetical protein HY960_06605 [Ignavibacteriae bacterium]|nr:hypothetical protein [Ignavibacteriota bacterium]
MKQFAHITFQGLLIAVLFLFFTAAGQEYLRFEHISVEQDLPQSTVTQIFQDSKGFIWFVTGDGSITRYDGYTLKIFDWSKFPDIIRPPHVGKMIEDRTGRFWLSTPDDGVYSINFQSKYIQHFIHRVNDSASLSNNSVNSLMVDKFNNIWIGTSRGLNLFHSDTKTFTCFRNDPKIATSLPNDEISFLFEDHANNLWIGTKNYLSKYDRTSNTFLNKRTNKNDDEQMTFVNSICESNVPHRSGLWLGTTTGLKYFDLSSFVLTEIDVGEVLSSNKSKTNVFAVVETKSDNNFTLWAGTQGLGLIKLEPFTRTIHSYTHHPLVPSSLSNNFVVSLLEDRAGMLWIGTDGGGINMFHPITTRFHHIKHEPENPSSLSDNFVFAILESQAEGKPVLWIGTRNGLNRIDRTTNSFTRFFHEERNPNSLSNNHIRALHESVCDGRKTLWIGTNGGGLDRLDYQSKKFTHYKHQPNNPSSLSNDYVWGISETHIGDSSTLWIATSDGLEQFNPQTNRFIHYRHNPTDSNSIADNNVHVVSASNENNTPRLWIGFGTHGLDLFEPKKNRFTHFKHTPSDSYSLNSGNVKCIYQTSANGQNTVWVGMDGTGLSRLDVASNTFSHFTISDGLPNNVIYGILEDNHGSLWLSTNKGLARYSPETAAIVSYDVPQGLQSNEYNTGAYFQNEQGDMFFGGINGLNYFHPDNITASRFMAPLVLSNFKVFDRLLFEEMKENQTITLSYKENFFSFEFASLDYINPKNNRYRYMLEGFDNIWNINGTRRFASYTDVDPGMYILRVIGTNSDGIENEKGISLTLIITPPFWKTAWFLTFVSLLILGGGVGVVRYISTKKLKRRIALLEQQHALEVERARIARDMHDELGAHLTSISLISEIAQTKNEYQPEVQNEFEKLAATSKEAVRKMDEIVWAISPKNDSLEKLVPYICSYAEQFLNVAAIACRFDVPVELPELRINSETRYNVFLVVKESLNNIVKHSGAHEVWIRIAADNILFTIDIEDNGKGFSLEHTSPERHGLENMQKRIADVGGTMRQVSIPSKGTTISITAPLERK